MDGDGEIAMHRNAMQSHSNAEALSNIAYGSPLGRSLGFFTGDDMCAPELQHETLSFATYETLLNRVQHGIAGGLKALGP